MKRTVTSQNASHAALRELQRCYQTFLRSVCSISPMYADNVYRSWNNGQKRNVFRRIQFTNALSYVFLCTKNKHCYVISKCISRNASISRDTKVHLQKMAEMHLSCDTKVHLKSTSPEMHLSCEMHQKSTKVHLQKCIYHVVQKCISKVHLQKCIYRYVLEKCISSWARGWIEMLCARWFTNWFTDILFQTGFLTERTGLHSFGCTYWDTPLWNSSLVQFSWTLMMNAWPMGTGRLDPWHSMRRR